MRQSLDPISTVPEPIAHVVPRVLVRPTRADGPVQGPM